MGLLAVGISHKTASIRVRERFFFTREKLKEYRTSLKDSTGIEGVVVLSTCNRMEIYLHSTAGRDLAACVIGSLASRFNAEAEIIRKYFYVLDDRDAARHLLRVASGLESQVLGETEILGQVKAAWLSGRESGVMDTFLDSVFAKAVETGIEVRNRTGISRGSVSIASVVMRILRERFRSLRDRTVMVIGAGKVAVSLSRYLKEAGIKGVFVANRTYEKACAIAGECGGEVVHFDRLREKLGLTDIVVSSTSCPHVILRKKMLEEVLKDRRVPLLLLDLAVPRDIDPQVKGIPGALLYDLDDLKPLVEESYRNRIKEAERAEDVIEEAMGTLYKCGALLRIGTRNSPLALKQVQEIIGYLRDRGVTVNAEIVGIDTAGDRNKNVPISEIEGTDFFTREIEEALLDRTVDIAVHSAKDLADSLPAGLRVAAVTRCIDIYDALISKNNLPLEKLPCGAKVAASSSRRKEQLKSYRDDLDIVDIRGNVEERLKKFDESGLDAMVLAACGLKRLGLEHRIAQRIPLEILRPHPLQGRLAVQTRNDDIELAGMLSGIDTRKAVS